MKTKCLVSILFHLHTCLLLTLVKASPAMNQTACPDWCGEDLEPRFNSSYHSYTFEVSQLLAKCDEPSSGNINISWSAPLEHGEVVTGYRVFWYAGNLNCECFDKDNREFILTNGTRGWFYPQSLAFMVKPLPRPRTNSDESFELNAVNCLTNNAVPSHVQSEHLEPTDSADKIKYIVVSMGVAIGVLLSLMFAVLWRKMHRNKQLVDEKQETPNLKEQLRAAKNSAYISYYSYNQVCTGLVHEIACWLIEQCIFTVMDRMYTCEISDIGVVDWIEYHMAEAKKVLIMCSKRYLEMCKLRELMQIHKGAAKRNLTTEQLKTLKEIAYIKRDMFLSGHCSHRFATVLIDVKEEDLPAWLREFPVCSWPQDKDKIIMFINDENETEKVVV